MKNVAIVLVEPSHPGNIGAVARAMKNMGFSDLVLIKPKAFPHPEAVAMASGAQDILEHARVLETLDEAIADCHWVLGTSARTRTLSLPLVSPQEATPKLMTAAQSGQVAIVFGRERTGLENDELLRCNQHVYIPTNPDYCSLNLAQAVLILCYECARANLSLPEIAASPQAKQSDLDYFYKSLEEMLADTGFLKPDNPRHLMSRMRVIFSKADLSAQELAMLQGAMRFLYEKPRQNT